MPIQKDWSQFSNEQIAAVPSAQGIYELGDTEGQIVYIGFTEKAEDIKSVLSHHLKNNPEHVKLFRILPVAFLQHPELLCQKHRQLFEAEYGGKPKLQDKIIKG